MHLSWKWQLIECRWFSQSRNERWSSKKTTGLQVTMRHPDVNFRRFWSWWVNWEMLRMFLQPQSFGWIVSAPRVMDAKADAGFVHYHVLNSVSLHDEWCWPSEPKVIAKMAKGGTSVTERSGKVNRRNPEKRRAFFLSCSCLIGKIELFFLSFHHKY